MCELCTSNPYYYGSFDKLDFILIRARRKTNNMNVGDWGFFQSSETSIVFSTTPYLYTNEDQLYESMDRFKRELRVDPQLGHTLVELSKKEKIPFNVRRQFVEYYSYNFTDRLYLFLADFINKSEPTTESDAFPQLDRIQPCNYNFDPKLPFDEYNEI